MTVKHKKCRYGPMMYLDNDKYIGHSLDKYGEAHFHQVEFLKQLVSEDDTVVDVGANIGTITIPLAKKVKRVVSFEPQAFIYNILCGNVALNDLHNVSIHNKAIHSTAGYLSVPYCDYSANANFGGIAAIPGGRDGYLVEAVRYPNIHLSPSLIKIDVEGGEADVLIAVKNVLNSCKPFIYVECTNNIERLLRIIDSFDYDWVIHEPPAYNQWSYGGHLLEEDDEDILKGMVSSNLICYHKGQRLVAEDKFLVRDFVMPRHREIQAIWQQIKSENN